MKVTQLKELITDLQATTISHIEIDSEGLKVNIDWQRGAPSATPSVSIVRAPIAGTSTGPEAREKSRWYLKATLSQLASCYASLTQEEAN
jgi:hypothetical protein